MNKSKGNMDKVLQETIEKLKAKGIPPKTAAYAAAIGYIKSLKTK